MAGFAKRWELRANSPVSASNSKAKAQEFIPYFLDFGLKQLQPTSLPIKILQDALTEMGAVEPLEAHRQERRITHNRQQPANFTAQLRDFVFNEIPVFNIWDSIALIYSISIEDVFRDREAELYEYQLKLIWQTAKATNWWIGNHMPSTSQSAWMVLPDKRMFVAFAFSCTPGKAGRLREEQVNARRTYNATIDSLVQASTRELQSLDVTTNKANGAGNPPGNCPEYETWALVCQGPGKFKSLCLSCPNAVSMQCCGHCVAAADAALSIGVQIEDLWDKTSLLKQGGYRKRNAGGYWTGELASTAEKIADKRGRKVMKKR
jgi:hypothetical protein